MLVWMPRKYRVLFHYLVSDFLNFSVNKQKSKTGNGIKNERLLRKSPRLKV